MRLITSLCCFFILSQSFSQTITNQEKINNYIQTYFQYDRENIHVQFNKNIYVNNEDLVFKGYVFSKKNNTPFVTTTNVQLVIYNEDQQIIQKQLLYTDKGTFSGGIHLNEKFKSGKYYFRFFTNWMNNFKENDSFTQTIEIINKNEPYTLNSNDPIWETTKVFFNPEGGIIIKDIFNAIGIKITDCNKKGIEISNGIIVDSKSKEITQFKTNKMGYGLFYLNPDQNETYTLKIKTDKLTLSQSLPKTQETGIVVTYNNTLSSNKLAIAIKTNENGVELYKNKNFILLIHQDGNSIQHPFNFDNNKTEQVILLDKKLMSNGVNSIRVIDENLNEITERLVYNDALPKQITSLEAKAIANDNILLTGKTAVNQADLSISVLPEKNACINQKRSILGTFYLNAYLENPEIDNYIYFDLDNTNRKQDIELLMLNQTHSKFYWENIKSFPPNILYPFDKGLTISGKVEKELKPNSNNKISLISFKDNVFDETAVDKNNNFKFEHFYVKDSTVFLLQMINEKNMTIATKMEARVTFNETPFKFPLLIDKTNCLVEKNKDNSFVFSKPKLEDNTIKLGEVIVKNNFKKDLFEHKNDMSLNANAYKIGENDFGTFLDFLSMHGYNTGVDPEENNVYIRSSRGAFLGNSSGPPAVYIDNVLLYDLNILFNIYIQDVDEVYIDQSGASDISIGSNGTIKIFLKLDRNKKEYFNIKHTSLIATKGFANPIEFKNTEFKNQKEFYYFGTLNWTPKVLPKDNSNFEIKFPRGNQTEVQVLIEGINNDGSLISEMKTIPISN